MDLLYIVLLILFGLLFLVVELLLLPGVSVGALLALGCGGTAVWLGFRTYGTWGGAAVLTVVLVLGLAAVAVSLRSRTWRRFALDQQIRSSSTPVEPSGRLRPGDRGRTLSRLAPMGKVEFPEGIFEAKTLGSYVDPQQEVEVVGFENFSVIVKTVK